MNTGEKNCLLKNQNNLVDNMLDVMKVCDLLLSSGDLTINLVEEIRGQVIRTERVRKLLEFLPFVPLSNLKLALKRSGNGALADQLESCDIDVVMADETLESLMSEDEKKRFLANTDFFAKHMVDVMKVCDLLVSSGDFTANMVAEIRSKGINTERVRALLTAMLTRKRGAMNSFNTALKESGNEALSKRLESSMENEQSVTIMDQLATQSQK